MPARPVGTGEISPRRLAAEAASPVQVGRAVAVSLSAIPSGR